MLFYRAALPLSSRTLTFVAGVIRRHRASIGSCWRKLNLGRQALLVLVYLRKGETFDEIAAGFEVGTATAWRCVNETVALLAARAPKLRNNLSDEEWERLREFLPCGPQRRGGRWADHRMVINGIFFRARRAARGGTCPRASGTGKPSITGIAAGPWTGPGSRSWTGCGPDAMRPKARTGRSARTPPSPGPISTRPGPSTPGAADDPARGRIE